MAAPDALPHVAPAHASETAPGPHPVAAVNPARGAELAAARTRPMPKATERDEFRYRLSVGCARLASWIVWALTDRGRERLALLGGRLFYRISPTYRENVRSNLRQILGPDPSEAELDAVIRNVFLTSARNFVDLLHAPRMSRAALIRAVDVAPADRARLDAALAGGKGAVIVSAHLGAFDFIGQGLHLLGYPLTVVTARTTARFVFDGVTYLRGAGGPALVEPTPAGIRRTIQTLRAGKCVAILVDRDFFQNGRPVVFFGHETTLPVGALRIARDTGAPIVPIFTRRVGDAYVLDVEPAFRVQRTADPEADLRAGLASLVPVLEAAIRRAPEQWVMFQRVWPAEPADPVRAFPVGSPFVPAPGPARDAGWRRWRDRLARRARRGG